MTSLTGDSLENREIVSPLTPLFLDGSTNEQGGLETVLHLILIPVGRGTESCRYFDPHQDSLTEEDVDYVVMEVP